MAMTRAAHSTRRPHPGVFDFFLRRRRVTRHYGRHAWWGHRVDVVGSAAHARAAEAVAAELLDAAQLDEPSLLHRWRSSSEGLTAAHAQRLRKRLGPNEVGHDQPMPWPVHLWLAYRNPFSLLLTLLAFLSGWTGDPRSAGVIGAMVALSTVLRFVQERRSNRAADALKAMVSSHASVCRPGQPLHELPMAQLVPGDVVQLSAGDMIPADGRLLAAKDLFVNQAAMTGEALPVEKQAGAAAPGEGHDPLALPNLVFMGSNVVSGSATMLVLNTGARTFFGTLARHATHTERAPTQFQSGVNQVSWLLIRFMLVMVPLVFIINGWTKGDWLEALVFALSVAVGLTPEMLPMIVTATLAHGATALSRQQVIVKRLDAIQNLGAMDVLCTDKTGTLTQDRIVLKRHTDAWGDDSDAVLKLAYLNSHFQTGLQNLLDLAVLAHEELGEWPAQWTKLDEIPFDFQRRRMSVVVAPRDAQQSPLLICKGAVEEVFAQCTRVRRGEADEPLTPDHLARLQATTAALNAEGLRVVAVATREVLAGAPAYHAADEHDLTLIGYVAFLDPPKDSTGPALAALALHGVRVMVLTGDNERVTRKVCEDVGLKVGSVLLGPAIEAMDDAALAQAVTQHNVYAKLAPAQKERIVKAVRAGGHVVGFMGDGINDAPALHAADVGISVDTAVDIAKEVADVILLEKSLMVLDDGVMAGRRTFANMLKYIKMAASSNFGNVLSVLLASVALPFLPMLPMHLLVQNLLYDVSQTPIPADTVDDDLLQAPQAWHPGDIGRFMLWFGPVSSVFDGLCFALLWWGFGANSVAKQSLFQSGWFVCGLLTQTLVVHLIRTPRWPFIQSRAAPALLATTVAVSLFGLALPFGPWADALRMVPLPMGFMLYLPVMLVGYLVAVQAVKQVFRARYGWQ